MLLLTMYVCIYMCVSMTTQSDSSSNSIGSLDVYRLYVYIVRFVLMCDDKKRPLKDAEHTESYVHENIEIVDEHGTTISVNVEFSIHSYYNEIMELIRLDNEGKGDPITANTVANAADTKTSSQWAPLLTKHALYLFYGRAANYCLSFTDPSLIPHQKQILVSSHINNNIQ